jgi:nucleoside-diphosphate-sugar epimerase
MRVVVVGATGNVGTSLVQSLAEEPAVSSVLGLARRLPAWQAPKTEWATADMSRDDLVPRFRSADVVVHLAWLFQPTHDPVTTWRVNVVGSSRVFQAVRQAEVPALVYASSVGAYSPGPKDRPVDESWPTHGWPTGAYSREKAYVERLLDAFEQARRPGGGPCARGMPATPARAASTSAARRAHPHRPRRAHPRRGRGRAGAVGLRDEVPRPAGPPAAPNPAHRLLPRPARPPRKGHRLPGPTRRLPQRRPPIARPQRR